MKVTWLWVGVVPFFLPPYIQTTHSFILGLHFDVNWSFLTYLLRPRHTLTLTLSQLVMISLVCAEPVSCYVLSLEVIFIDQRIARVAACKHFPSIPCVIISTQTFIQFNQNFFKYENLPPAFSSVSTVHQTPSSLPTSSRPHTPTERHEAPGWSRTSPAGRVAPS